MTKDNDTTFYHGRKASAALGELLEEFRRLALNQLTTIDNLVMDLLNRNRGLSVLSFNAQSVRAHVHDLNDPIMQKCNILMLSETCLKNEEDFPIPNFDCIIKFKRPNIRNGGVAVYSNSSNNTLVFTPSMDMHLKQIDALAVNASVVGDICAATCRLENGLSILTVAVYISPGQSIENIIKFFHSVLSQQSEEHVCSTKMTIKYL